MDSLTTGHIVDHKYRILTILGEGGMGAVYRAQHLLTEQQVALKVLHGGVGQEKLARRFKTEVSIGSRVQHPGIPAVFDAGQEADTGRLYFAMELLEGESLRDRMDNGADADEIVRWLRDALHVMAAAHAEGVLHRDLKPENLFLELTADGERLRVLDFGIARDLARPSRTTTGTAVGTAFYMAPEQATGKREITPKVDVWAVGVMLYEALAGVLPFDGPSAHAVVVEAVTEPHQPLSEHRPDLGHGWGALVDRCLEKKAELRPSSIEASEVLDKLLKDSGNLAPVFELDRRRQQETADTAAALVAVAQNDAAAAPTEEAMAVGVGESAVHMSSEPARPRRIWMAAAGLLAMGGLGAAGVWAAWPASEATGTATREGTAIADPDPVETPTVEAPTIEPEEEPQSVEVSSTPEAETAPTQRRRPRIRRGRVAAVELEPEEPPAAAVQPTPPPEEARPEPQPTTREPQATREPAPRPIETREPDRTRRDSRGRPVIITQFPSRQGD
ncbi:MAG: protein kinase [Sandaracinaceae bacterium]